MTVAGSFLFWLGTSPLIRYGCVYVYLTSAVVPGGIYDVVINHNCRAGSKWRYVVSRLCIAAVVLLVAYKLLALGGEIIRSYSNDYWLTQKDYENYEVIPYELGGVTFYYPARGDQVGYVSFPSSPAVAQIGFLGEDIADGFYSLP